MQYCPNYPCSGRQKAVTIQLGDTSLRIIDEHGELITTVPRASGSAVSRFTAYGNRQPR